MKNQKGLAPRRVEGFTLIELMVVIAIIIILSVIVLYSVGRYIGEGKDSNISGNLSVLVPAGEVWYNIENAQAQDGYNGFCDSTLNSAIKNSITQMPVNQDGSCYDPNTDTTQWGTNNTNKNPAGVCCNYSIPNYDAWAACAREFSNPNYAYCVDSRGVKKEIDKTDCENIGAGSISQCP